MKLKILIACIAIAGISISFGLTLKQEKAGLKNDPAACTGKTACHACKNGCEDCGCKRCFENGGSCGSCKDLESD
jgi:hypothetical protein